MKAVTGKDRHGNEVTVTLGDYVGFKCDVEQSGRVTRICLNGFSGGILLTLENDNGFSGEYIGGETMTDEFLSDCWTD